MAAKEREVVVVGAGVIGLSSVYRLLEDISTYDNSNIKYYITLLAAKGPDLNSTDISYSPQYTSFFAGAHQRPFPNDYSDDEKLTFQRRESIYTSDTFSFFAARKWNHDTESTIKFTRGYDCIVGPSKEYANFNDGYNNQSLKNFCSNDRIDPDLVPVSEQAACDMICSYDTYVVNTPVYLTFLLKKCIELSRKAGTNVEFKYDFNVKLHCLRDAIIHTQTANKPLIVNCTGAGLQWASSKPDENYFPIRGQTLLISVPKQASAGKENGSKENRSKEDASKENESKEGASKENGSKESANKQAANVESANVETALAAKFETSTITHQKGNTWTFLIQRPLPESHPEYASKLYFIVGGTKQANSTVVTASESDTATLLQNGKQIFPNLFKQKWKLERTNVGFRPARKGGSDVSLVHRVWQEEPFAVVNAIGFAGYGVECSMGAAQHVVSLVKRGFRESLL